MSLMYTTKASAFLRSLFNPRILLIPVFIQALLPLVTLAVSFGQWGYRVLLHEDN